MTKATNRGARKFFGNVGTHAAKVVAGGLAHHGLSAALSAAAAAAPLIAASLRRGGRITGVGHKVSRRRRRR